MSTLQYETPENVQLRYQPAGLGTRFVAWFIDSIILHVGIFVAFILLVILAAASDVFREQVESWSKQIDKDAVDDPEKLGVYMMGIGFLIWGFSSFFYYGLSELLWRGQTIGKRVCRIRVVKGEGFSLDALSVFVRNIFRVADHLPILWVVPLLSAKSQRLGDMAAGTVVVSDEARGLPTARSNLALRSAADAKFRFDHVKLGRLRPSDVSTVERILSSWNALPFSQRQQFGDRVVPALCHRMQVDEPPLEERQAFLEDLLAAEYRRQERRLN